MYRIKMLCFGAGNPAPYEDVPVCNYTHKTKADALQVVYDMAEEEVNELNNGCDEFISFGVVDDDETVRVLCYLLDGEEDTTGETEQVTVYYIEEE